MGANMPDNAKQSFKCSQCGYMFSTQDQAGECPSCGFYCDTDSCQMVDASDEDY